MVKILECIFLNIFSHIRTKLGWKKIFIIGLQNYFLSSMADLANRARIGGAHQLVVLKPNDEIFFWCSFCLHIFKEFQKSALSTLFHFVGVRAAYQPHVNNLFFRIMINFILTHWWTDNRNHYTFKNISFMIVLTIFVIQGSFQK